MNTNKCCLSEIIFWFLFFNRFNTDFLKWNTNNNGWKNDNESKSKLWNMKILHVLSTLPTSKLSKLWNISFSIISLSKKTLAWIKKLKPKRKSIQTSFNYTKLFFCVANTKNGQNLFVGFIRAKDLYELFWLF